MGSIYKILHYKSIKDISIFKVLKCNVVKFKLGSLIVNMYALILS